MIYISSKAAYDLLCHLFETHGEEPFLMRNSSKAKERGVSRAMLSHLVRTLIEVGILDRKQPITYPTEYRILVPPDRVRVVRANDPRRRGRYKPEGRKKHLIPYWNGTRAGEGQKPE